MLEQRSRTGVPAQTGLFNRKAPVTVELQFRNSHVVSLLPPLKLCWRVYTSLLQCYTQRLCPASAELRNLFGADVLDRPMSAAGWVSALPLSALTFLNPFSALFLPLFVSFWCRHANVCGIVWSLRRHVRQSVKKHSRGKKKRKILKNN